MLRDGAHTTNYNNTLILPASDCKATISEVPTKPGTIADLQYQMLTAAPYGMTSDDLLVAVTGARRDVPQDEHDDLRAELFSKGQPCLRASPLVKTHGWAIHHDAHARVALVAQNDPRFSALSQDVATAKVEGMRNKRA
jgi:hypothetical protein